MNLEQKIEEAKERMEGESHRKVKYHLKPKSKKLTIRKRIWNWVNESKFVLAIIMLAIGISGTVCFYEGQALRRDYLEAIGYWDGYQARKLTIINETAQAQEPEQKQEEVKETRAEQIVRLKDLIWSNESSRGVNNFSKCEAIGQVNEIGFAIPGDGTYICFKNHAEQMEALEKWLKNHFSEGMEERELLCHYSGSNYAGCVKKQ